MGQLERIKPASLPRLLKTPSLYTDGGGLALRVKETGAAAWVYRYMENGRSFEMGLGALSAVSIAKAREKARALRAQRAEGIDPLGDEIAGDRVSRARLVWRPSLLAGFGMAAEAITVRASGDQPERRFAPDSGHLAITVKPFQRSFETDAIYPVEGHPYTENRVIYGVGRLTFSDKFGWVNKADAGVFEGREFRVSIVDRGDDSSAYASDDLAFGLSLPRERFDALWEAAARMPSAELHVSGDVEVYRLQDGYDSVSYLATDKRNQLGPVSIKLVEGSFNDTPTTALTPARRGGDELAKGLRTITRLLWAILTLLLIVALKN